MGDAEPISAEAATQPMNEVPEQYPACPVCGIMSHGGRRLVEHQYLTVKIECALSSDGPTAFAIFIAQIQERGYLQNAVCIHGSELSVRVSRSILIDVERMLNERRLIEDFSWARSLLQAIRGALRCSQTLVVFRPEGT